MKQLKKDTSPKINQRSKFKDELDIRELAWTEKQRQLIDIGLDKNTQLLFIKGGAGTGKSLLAAYLGLKLLNDKKISDIIFTRSLVESSTKSIGALPGLVADKMAPFLLTIQDKMEELLGKADIASLYNDNRIQTIPIGFLRGASMNCKYIWGEEVQNLSLHEITMLLTRLGKHGKMVLTGDSAQSDIGRKSGFAIAYDMFNTPEAVKAGIRCFEFTSADIMRSGICQFIVQTIEKYHNEQDSKMVKRAY